MKGVEKGLLLLTLFCTAIPGCGRELPVKKGEELRASSDVRYGKELEEIRKDLRGDIKIKLRRDGKGAYSWEIAGKSPEEIIRANNTLSKKIDHGKQE